jgi:CubicO group peptidase (beta-lactamase class C family)
MSQPWFCSSTNRSALCWRLLAICLVSVSFASAPAQSPVSGQPVPALIALDTLMQQLLTQYSCPGASLAVSVNGKLIFARGYDYADIGTGEFVQPDSLFRTASNSKPLTAAGILQLIAQGKINMATQPFASILSDLTPPPGETMDPRILSITIQNLLEHKAGWDATVPGVPDPLSAYTVTAAQAFNAIPPATPELLIRYMMGQPLQHAPGTVSAYSNFGYVVLGEIISRVSGQAYGTFIQNAVLAPAGDVRSELAGTFFSERQPYEVAYYDYPGAPLASSVFPPLGAPVPAPYGAFSIELSEAAGGWISSSIDLVRLTDNLNGQLTPAVLQSPPAGFVGYIAPYGPVWQYIWFGAAPGDMSLLHLNTYGYDGFVTWAALFNSRDSTGSQPASAADTQIAAVLEGINSWPTGDLFTVYKGTGTSCSFSLASHSQHIANSSATGTVAVTDANYCAWSAVSNSPWLHITAGSLNSDSNTVAFSIDANSGAARTGTLTIAGNTFSVIQDNLFPAVSLSAFGVPFIAQPVGVKSAIQTVILTNSGTASLSISNISLSGVNAGDFGETNTCPASLAPAANCTLSLTFTPAGSGSRSGALTIADSAPGSPHSIALTGTGGPDVTISAISSPLDIASPGASASATLNFAAAAGFSGSASLTCSSSFSGSGTSTDPPTCTLSPASLSFASTKSGSAALAITTTPPQSATLHNRARGPGSGSTCLTVVLLVLLSKRRKLYRIVVLASIAALFVTGGCNGGNSQGVTSIPSNPGTTPGSYVLTITASTPDASATSIVNLTVE